MSNDDDSVMTGMMTDVVTDIAASCEGPDSWKRFAATKTPVLGEEVDEQHGKYGAVGVTLELDSLKIEDYVDDDDDDDEGYGSYGANLEGNGLLPAAVDNKLPYNTALESKDTVEIPRPLRPAQIQYSIRLGNGVDPPITLLDGREPSYFNVHLQVIDREGLEVDNIKICAYSRENLQPYYKQPESGCVYKDSSILNYTFRVEDTDNLMCCLSMCHGDGTFLARGYLSLDNLTAMNRIKLPLINETDTIVGLLNCSIVEIRGLEAAPATSKPRTQCATTPTTLEIGHRGCGVTHTDRELFSELPCLPENTIASMETAWRHGAHMVETDVAVTQDLKAVLYHDLEIELSHARKLPISHVTSHVLEGSPTETLQANETQRHKQLMLDQGDCSLSEFQEKSKLYPYLSDALNTLPADLGIMLEVKANLQEVGEEYTPYHRDKNLYIDVILSELFENVGDRKIVLCSFCADTCVLLRNKQDRWPIVLIAQGSTDTYPDYLDERLQCLRTSVNFALAENLQGVSVFSGLLKENAGIVVDAIKSTGLKTYVWGYHCCEKEFRAELRSHKVDGIIYDRIYEETGLAKRSIIK